MEQHEGKLRCLTLQEKLELISIVESGRSVKDVAEEYSVNRNTLHYIIKNKETIKSNCESRPDISNCKRVKKAKCPELEKRILEYMVECRDRNEKLSGSSIKAMALQLASELQVENFSASNGWLFGLFKRHQITIGDFNKGIGPSIQPHIVPANDSVNYIKHDTDSQIETVHEIYEETTTTFEDSRTSKPEYELVNYEFTSNSEYFETEIVEEMENEEKIVETAQEPDCSWRTWCRMCGSCEGSQAVEEDKIEIFQQITNIYYDDTSKICNECNVSLDDVYKVVCRAKVVESMLVEIQERESNEILTSETLSEIRRDFGLEVIDESYHEEDLVKEENVEEGERYEEVIYESLDSIEEDLDSQAMEEIETEQEVEEQQVEFSEEIQTSDQQQSFDEEPKDNFNFKCHLCHEPAFQFMHSLTIHTREVHKSLPKVLCPCGRYLSTWEGLMSHKRKHASDQKIFKCVVCASAFATKTGLSIHVKFKHSKPAQDLTCPTCKRTFKDATVLKTHLRTHLPDEEKYAFECGICGKRMANKWSVKYHISSIHEQQKTHECHLCDRKFGNKSNLRSHLISHTTENVTCEICGNKFKNRISLQSHKKLHKPENAKNFACQECNKTFFNRNHLARHMTAHSDERKFKCHVEFCSNEYKWQKDLQNHIASAHTGEKIHKCPWCSKSFVDPSNLRKHKLSEHPEDLRIFEAEYGKRRRIDKLHVESIVTEDTEVD